MLKSGQKEKEPEEEKENEKETETETGKTHHNAYMPTCERAYTRSSVQGNMDTCLQITTVNQTFYSNHIQSFSHYPLNKCFRR